jgi:hypothetical protein
MSIPLDNLYNFLEDSIDQDIIIYRWFPHGSRNLEDLSWLKDYQSQFDLEKIIKTPVIICHDQEPLNYQYYKFDDFIDVENIRRRKNHLDEISSDHIIKLNHLLRYMFDKLHIRLAAKPYIPSLHDYTLLLHSEKNSIELEKFINHRFVPVYYWSHALIARDWFRYAKHDPKLNKSNICYDFLIYNRAWSGTREYRLKFTELMIDNQLVNVSLTRFNPIDQEIHYGQHHFLNNSLATTRLDIESFFEHNQYPSDSSGSYCTEDYQKCAIEIVLETLFDDSRWHLTEKTLRPIACGKPFILAATAGSLKYLKSYGFKTFAPFIDESYDNILDPAERLNAITQSMKNFSSLDQSAKKTILNQMNEICRYNKKLFFSREFQQTIMSEYQLNMQDGLQQLHNQSTKKSLQQYMQFPRLPDLLFDKSSKDIEVAINKILNFDS